MLQTASWVQHFPLLPPYWHSGFVNLLYRDMSRLKQINHSLIGFEDNLRILFIYESYMIKFWGIQKLIIPYSQGKINKDTQNICICSSHHFPYQFWSSETVQSSEVSSSICELTETPLSFCSCSLLSGFTAVCWENYALLFHSLPKHLKLTSFQVFKNLRSSK